MDGHEAFLSSVFEIASEGGNNSQHQLGELLSLGCKRFGMDIGVATSLQGDDLTILASHEPWSDHFPPGKKVDLLDTACAEVVACGGYRFLNRKASNQHLFDKLPPECCYYCGIPIRIDGHIIGTLCFLKREPVSSAPRVKQQEFELLALVVAGLLERRYHLNTEHELRQIASIVEASEDAIFTETLDRVILTWNSAAEKLFGYTAEEVIGKPANMMYPGSNGNHVLSFMEKVKRGERSENIEAVNVRKDGKHINTSFTLTPIRDAGGEVVAAAVVLRSLDERKKAELALARSEQRYALVAKSSNDGLWDWDLATNEVYYSPRWKSLFGYPEDAADLTFDDWRARVSDNCKAQFDADLAMHLSGRADKLNCVYKIITCKGEERWVLCRGVAVRDDNGKPTRLAGSISDITRQKESEAELIKQARHDRLTGLPNRAYVTDILRSALARARRNKSYKFALLFLDFDRFKVVNDSLGHEFGDMLLISIAQRLRVQLRTVDTAARLGGDEFVVLLDGVDGIQGTIQVVERLMQTFAKPHNLGGHDVTSTASIGIVLNNDQYEKPDEVIRDADTAMYHAKATGKARYVLFDEQMHAKALNRLNMEKDLRSAIALGQMKLVYQPIVSLETSELQGFEALLRWNHPEDGPVSPDLFIEIAEETGEIVKIGRWVLQQACKQLSKWKKGYPQARDLFMNVNISKRQIAHPGVIKQLITTFEETRVDPRDIKLEITESVIMDDRQGITPVLEQIRSLGVQLAMDDFGTGHSSLSCLHRFPINVLKIDREFIGNMEQRVEYTAVIQAIVTLAHTMGISVVAEGIETAAQVAQLQALECDNAQGYYFSQPLSAAKATDYILGTHEQRLTA